MTLFSVPALLIMCAGPRTQPQTPPAPAACRYRRPRPLCPLCALRFREALEAAVIVSVLLTLVEKMKMQQLKKHGARGAQTGAASTHVQGPHAAGALACLPVLPCKGLHAPAKVYMHSTR